MVSLLYTMNEETLPVNTGFGAQPTLNETLQLVLEQLKSQGDKLSSIRDGVKGSYHYLHSGMKRLKGK